MIDHLELRVKNYEASKTFYLKVLAPIGYELIRELTKDKVPSLPVAKLGGFGVAGKPDLWLREDDNVKPTHVAFRAADNAAVDAFHKAAMAAGATDNGAAGPRAHYHPHYYGAFVLDPSGHNLEVVCHGPIVP